MAGRKSSSRSAPAVATARVEKFHSSRKAATSALGTRQLRAEAEAILATFDQRLTASEVRIGRVLARLGVE